MMLAIIFDSVGVGEWLILLAVVLVVVGPKRLPATARTIGRHYAKFRRAADSFKRQLLEMDSEMNRAIEDAAREVETAANDIVELFNFSTFQLFNSRQRGNDRNGRRALRKCGDD